MLELFLYFTHDRNHLDVISQGRTRYGSQLYLWDLSSIQATGQRLIEFFFLLALTKVLVNFVAFCVLYSMPITEYWILEK